MKYFSIKELRCKCCGALPPFARENIEALVRNVLDPAREALGKPIIVTSGYRCPEHNAAVGGVKNSQHMAGEAADIYPAEIAGQARNEALAELARIIKEQGKFDQLILYPTLLHVSYKRTGTNRHRVLRKISSEYQILNPLNL